MGFAEILRRSIRIVPYGLRGQVKKVPFVGAAQRSLVDRYLTGRPFVHTIDAGPAKGVTFELVLPDDKGIWTGTYEPEFAARLASVMKPGMVGYDIGAWHGYFAGIMLAQGAREVVMFEPLLRNRERLARFVVLNPDRAIRVEPVALGDYEGSATLVSSSATSMARLSNSPFLSDLGETEDVSVSLRTLDVLLAEGTLPPPDILKIDVEGAEAMVLRGAEAILASARPVVLAEIHSSNLMDEVRTILERHAYMVETIDASNLRREADASHICAWPAA